MDAATWLLVGICFCAGLFGGSVQNWRLHRRLYALEVASAHVEEILVRETKKRAAGERWDKSKAEQMAAEILQRSRAVNGSAPEPVAPVPGARWWDRR